jgi:hypothetical protein
MPGPTVPASTTLAIAFGNIGDGPGRRRIVLARQRPIPADLRIFNTAVPRTYDHRLYDRVASHDDVV